MTHEKHQLREDISDMLHEYMCTLIDYLYRSCKHNADGTLTLPAHLTAIWRGRSKLVYRNLCDNEKDVHREQADKILALFEEVSHD